ncbi:hypothetical protein B0H13DRAFT_1858895 [Mycena leptocephala]|nr:hypothetical protein B0H13DRAFT_1858895 [Mycena leptocephala]
MTKRAMPILQPATIDLVDPPGQVVTRIDPQTGIHWVTCDLCHSEIEMTIVANRYTLLKHRNSQQSSRDWLTLSYAPYCNTDVTSELSSGQFIRTWRSNDSNTKSLQDTWVANNWSPGSHWMAFPYLQRGVRAVGWEPIGFGPDDKIQFRAENCKVNVRSASTGPCISCQVLPSSSDFNALCRGQRSMYHIHPGSLTAEQQLAMMTDMAETNKDLRTQASQLG